MLKNPYTPESKVYVFGEDNYAMTQELGFDAVLVDKRPIIWDMDTEQFRHKLEVFDRAMEDFDEIVFLDWDTIPVKPIPDNFWDVLGEKDAIQANSIMYRRRKAMWRGRKDSRKLSCAAFVYCRDKKITEGMIDTWIGIIMSPTGSQCLVYIGAILQSEFATRRRDFFIILIKGKSQNYFQRTR
jgi:hypothetical protein